MERYVFSGWGDWTPTKRYGACYGRQWRSRPIGAGQAVPLRGWAEPLAEERVRLLISAATLRL